MNEAYKCPKCNKPPARTETKFGTRYDCCGLWAWGDYPLVDADTHEARKFAHRVFDQLWVSGAYTRSEAYTALADELGLSPDECHMKLMNAETAQRVPYIAFKLMHGGRARNDTN